MKYKLFGKISFFSFLGLMVLAVIIAMNGGVSEETKGLYLVGLVLCYVAVGFLIAYFVAKGNAKKRRKHSDHVVKQMPGDISYTPSGTYTPYHSNNKGQKSKKPLYKRWWFWLIIVFAVFGSILSVFDNGSSDTRENDHEATVSQEEQEKEVKPVETELSWWDKVVSNELANDIETALDEIGVTDEIEGIELDEVRESALFVTRIYRLSTKKFDYWIWTNEWNDGEPEHEIHPTEYLTAIKNWNPDGHMGTNLWDEDGTGSEQNYKFSDTLD